MITQRYSDLEIGYTTEWNGVLRVGNIARQGDWRMLGSVHGSLSVSSWQGVYGGLVAKDRSAGSSGDRSGDQARLVGERGAPESDDQCAEHAVGDLLRMEGALDGADRDRNVGSLHRMGKIDAKSPYIPVPVGSGAQWICGSFG